MVGHNLDIYSESAATDMSDAAAYMYTSKCVEFVLRYLYSPDSLGVSEEDSRACNSAVTANFGPFTQSTFFCYGNSGTVMVDA